MLGTQAHNVETRPIAIAMAHREVHILAREVYVVQRCRHTEIDARMLFGEAAKTIYQPFGGKIGRRADGEDAGTLTLKQAFCAHRYPVKRIPHDGKVIATSVGNDQTLTLAIEEFDPQLQFQGFDLVAHR